jgi:biotin carboxylase
VDTSDRWILTVELNVLVGTDNLTAVDPHNSVAIVALCATRSQGFKTAVAAVDPSFYPEYVNQFVDRWIVCDTQSPQAIVQATRASLSGGVAATYSFLDNFVGVAASVAELLGSRGTTPGSTATVRDKSAVRRALDEQGVANVRWATASLDEAHGSPIGYPCIVKPIDGAASWDVVLAFTDEQVRSLADEHRSRTYGRGVSPKGILLFEQFVDGELYSAEGFVDGNDAEVWGYSGRDLTGPPRFTELALTFSAAEPCEGANAYIQKVLSAANYSFGPFHVEFMVTDHGPILIEINARIAGLGAHRMLTRCLRRDIVDYVIARFVGDQRPIGPCIGAGFTQCVIAPLSGTLTGVGGVEDARLLPGVDFIQLLRSTGQTVSAKPKSNSDILALVGVWGNDPAEARSRAEHASQSLQIAIATVPECAQ